MNTSKKRGIIEDVYLPECKRRKALSRRTSVLLPSIKKVKVRGAANTQSHVIVANGFYSVTATAAIQLMWSSTPMSVRQMGCTSSHGTILVNSGLATRAWDGKRFMYTLKPGVNLTHLGFNFRLCSPVPGLERLFGAIPPTFFPYEICGKLMQSIARTLESSFTTKIVLWRCFADKLPIELLDLIFSFASYDIEMVQEEAAPTKRSSKVERLCSDNPGTLWLWYADTKVGL